MATFPTPITPSTRYSHRGETKIYAVGTIANIQAPTRAELTAGTDLSGQIVGSAGWEITRNQEADPDLGTKFEVQFPTDLSVADSSLTFRASRTGTDARSVLPRDTATNIVILYGGDVAGNKMNVFPMTVRTVSAPVEVTAGRAVLTVSFSPRAEPAENITVPAHTP